MIKLKSMFVVEPDNHSIEELQNHFKNLLLGNPLSDRLSLFIEFIKLVQEGNIQESQRQQDDDTGFHTCRASETGFGDTRAET